MPKHVLAIFPEEFATPTSSFLKIRTRTLGQKQIPPSDTNRRIEPHSPPKTYLFDERTTTHLSLAVWLFGEREVTVIPARYQRAQRRQRSAIRACRHISERAFQQASIQHTAYGLAM